MKAYIGLGSNLADPLTQLNTAVREIAALPQTTLTAVSSFYRTQPFGVTHRQPAYLNAVVTVETTLSPDALLTALHHIERQHHRARPYRFAPRTLDLDILLYGNLIRRGRRVILPHPRLHQRAFALIPLLEIAPDVVIPGRGKARFGVRRLAAACSKIPPGGVVPFSVIRLQHRIHPHTPASVGRMNEFPFAEINPDV